MRLFYLLIIPVFFMLTSLRATPGDNWVLEMEKEGVRVYTQLDESSPYKQIKVTTTINASVDKVMEILLAFNGYKNWVNHISESYLINKTDTATYYVFTLEEAKWPMQDRYLVSKIDVNQTLNTAKMNFRSVPNYIEKRTDAIQIKHYEGYWEIKNRPNHQCTLEYVLIQNPGGHVPPWLANFRAVENPFKSVCNLKRIAEQESIRP